MMSRLMCAMGLALMAGAASAQQTDNQVAVSTDWSVFQETNPTECFAVSAPRETVNTVDGQVVAVNRGEIQLFVLFRPGANVAGQVAFTGGYPFASGSTVSVVIGGTTFQLFTEGDWAWPASPEDDARIVDAMRRGADAVVTGRSGRGTTTRDTFSLAGFTAATAEAQRRCSS